MYKIFINDATVYLLSDCDTSLMEGLPKEKRHLFCDRSSFGFEDIFPRIEAAESGTHFIFCDDNLGALKKRFFDHFKLISAAGGLVFNDKDEMLFIYRNGKWDLPKGKVERGEDLEDAAVREVEEETNVKHTELLYPIIQSKLNQEGTYHCFEQKGRRQIKLTYWYVMKCSGHQKLKPQREEGITKAIWVKKSDVAQYLGNTYLSIKDVVEQALVLER